MKKRVPNFWLQWNVSLNLQMSTMISMFRHIERADWPSSASSIFVLFFKYCLRTFEALFKYLFGYRSSIAQLLFRIFSSIFQSLLKYTSLIVSLPLR